MPIALLDLPEDILHRIAKYLPRQSAISLAGTCSGLQPFGVQAAWQILNISLQRTFNRTPEPAEWTEPLGGERLYKIRQMYLTTGYEAGESGVDDHIQVMALSQYLQELYSIISSSKMIKNAVQEITYDIDRLLSRRFRYLLILVSPTLRSLELLGPEYPFLSAPSQGFFNLEQLFQTITTPFLALRHLEFPLNENWEDRIRHILPLTPNLQSLKLSASQRYYGGWGNRPEYHERSSLEDWPVLPSLRKLEVEVMYPQFSEMVAALVRRATSLDEVAIGDPDMAWDPQLDDEILDALATRSLRRLETSSKALKMLMNQKGACIMTSLGQVSLEGETTEESLHPLKDIDIPALPQMKHLTLHLPFATEHVRFWQFAGDWGSLPLRITGIDKNILGKIHNAPELKLIHIPPVPHRAKWNEGEWTYWGSRQCFENRDRVILIRTYHYGDDTFTHLRVYHPQLGVKLEFESYRAEDVWEELTAFRGQVVSARVLGEVYDTLEESAGWTEPMRGAELPEAAWRLLVAAAHSNLPPRLTSA